MFNPNKNKNCKSVFTLQGSQPYVLTSQWPKAFTPNMCEFVPDYSLQNVQAANDISYLHPVNFPLRLKPKCNKRN